ANTLTGPWLIHGGGVLRLEETSCHSHIASPDVLIRNDERRIFMYFHGCTSQGQRTFLATSSDGIHFEAQTHVLCPSYFRVFTHVGAWFDDDMRIERAYDVGGDFVLRSRDVT